MTTGDIESYMPSYIETFEKWASLARATEWQKWSNNILARPKGYIYPDVIADLHELHGWMIAVEYRLPNKFPEFQAAFEDFRITLKDLISIFFKYFERSGDDGIYWLEKIEFQTHSDRASLEEVNYVSNYNGPGGYLEDVMVELTCAANHLIEVAQKSLQSTAKTPPKKCEIVYLGGPHGPSRQYVPEYDADEKAWIVEYWLTADRLSAILDKSGSYVQPDFVPLIHRKEKCNSQRYRRRRPKDWI